MDASKHVPPQATLDQQQPPFSNARSSSSSSSREVCQKKWWTDKRILIGCFVLSFVLVDTYRSARFLFGANYSSRMTVFTSTTEQAAASSSNTTTSVVRWNSTSAEGQFILEDVHQQNDIHDSFNDNNKLGRQNKMGEHLETKEVVTTTTLRSQRLPHEHEPEEKDGGTTIANTTAVVTIHDGASGLLIEPIATVYMPFSTWANFTMESLSFSFDRNFFQNGLIESPFLKLVDFNDTVPLILQNKPVFWIFDPSHNFPRYACHILLKKMETIQEQLWERGHYTPTPNWSVAFYDTRDHAEEIFNCPHTLDIFLRNISKSVPYWKRSVAIQRSFNATTNALHPGRLHPGIVNVLSYPRQNETSPTLPSMPLHHSPINVRTDQVQQLEDFLSSKEFEHSSLNLTLASPIESIFPRPRHVAHFFPPSLKGIKDEAPHLAGLRCAVSQTILDYAKKRNSNLNNGTRIDVFANVVGKRGETGRSTPQQSFLKELLRTKIVVVAQRDTWEDHWRLFESIVSGAMVMTDVMLGLPSGLVHGESIVVFHNLTQLQEQLDYYLDPANENERISIATKGRHVAMSRHRSWHRMEEMAFGRPMSTCAVSTQPDCPYTVHAK